MTTIRRYECNLCRDQITKATHEPNDKAGKAGIGILFGAGMHGVKLFAKQLHDAESHICKECAVDVARLVGELDLQQQ